MFSVNTNTNAMVALQSLSQTNTDLAATQKQVSTGLKVADATDDGAAYAVAQGVRSSVSVLTAVNNQLGNVQGLLSVTNNAFSSSTTLMSTIAGDLANWADAPTTDEQSQYQTQFTNDVAKLTADLKDASYNGQSLISDTGTSTNQTYTADEASNKLTLTGFDAQNLLSALGSITTASAAGTALSSTGTFAALQTSLLNAANQTGADTTFVGNQVSYNSAKIDSLNTGLGSLVDANLAQESAQLTSLQIKQQLGEQALSISNQAPQGLLSLFR